MQYKKKFEMWDSFSCTAFGKFKILKRKIMRRGMWGYFEMWGYTIVLSI